MKRFDNFQPTIETFAKKIGIIGESHDMPDLFGDDSAQVVMSISPNHYSTHQVFNRFAGTSFIPPFVANRINSRNVKTPISVVSPDSSIRTFATHRQVNYAPIQSGSLYFTRPSVNEQFQVATKDGEIFGIRQMIDGKSVHLNLNRFPHMMKIKAISEELHGKLKTDLMRFRVGLGSTGPVFLAMENFKLHRPELTSLYYSVYESFIGHMPEWFKNHIESTMIIPYLNEYINRDAVRKKCPYIL